MGRALLCIVMGPVSVTAPPRPGPRQGLRRGLKNRAQAVVDASAAGPGHGPALGWGEVVAVGANRPVSATIRACVAVTGRKGWVDGGH